MSAGITYDDFVARLRNEPAATQAPAPKATAERSVAFARPVDRIAQARATPSESAEGGSFAARLLKAAGFGEGAIKDRGKVLPSHSAATRCLPERVRYFAPEGDVRSHHVILLEFAADGAQIFESAKGVFVKSGRLDILEDALDRFAQDALRAFGQTKSDDQTPRGEPHDTLCVISVLDHRVRDTMERHIIHFSTVSASDDDTMESFTIRQECVSWDDTRSKVYTKSVYDRAFQYLNGHEWKQAFARKEERTLIRKVAAACLEPTPQKEMIEEKVVNLLDEVAKSFGLKSTTKGHLVRWSQLPTDHEIGEDPNALRRGAGAKISLPGIVLRDVESRFLGYVIYCLGTPREATALRERLRAHNRFQNVLVIYPEDSGVQVELWQGRESFEGKLTRAGARYKEEGRVISFLSRFFVISRSRIGDPKELAEELADRARFLRRMALDHLQKEGELSKLYKSFKKNLIHDQDEGEFADAYAQTLTYGLLAARWVSKDLYEGGGVRFTCASARAHLPKTSPFLRDLFETVLDANFDYKQQWLLDDIADLLDRTDVTRVFASKMGQSTVSSDPVIHFYEPFLAAYDAKLRELRGVYYTPEPIVSFIVRSVDDILKREMHYEGGLADAQKISRRIGDQTEEVHRVQILDPATGTGTFLRRTIDQIRTSSKGAEGWPAYVRENLLPRLHGFEILMASYAVAHLKLGLDVATELGGSDEVSIDVSLTNALEMNADAAGTEQFDVWLAAEAHRAARTRRDLPISVVIGNPPYSGHSANKNPWIQGLLAEYKKGCPELSKPGQAKWLSDDYCKFIRFAQWRIEQTGYGVIGLITNHAYLENPTFRGMRRSLMETFDALYVIDLHGNTKKKEVAPGGGADGNVFDIQQGVAILLGVKRPPGVGGARGVWRHDLWGTREQKYAWLNENDVSTVPWGADLKPPPPQYLFARPDDEGLTREYEAGWRIPDIFSLSGDPAPGIVTTHDEFAISWTKKDAQEKVEALLATRNEAEARKRFSLCTQNQWVYKRAKEELADGAWRKQLVEIVYRPFDRRWTVYNRNVAVHRRERLSSHLLDGNNVALVTSRQKSQDGEWTLVGVVNGVVESTYISNKTKEINYAFPLRFQADEVGEPLFATKGKAATRRRVNFGGDYLRELAKHTGLRFVEEGVAADGEFGPEDVFSFVFAVLHAPQYRSRYQDCLGRDFPRIHVPRGASLFRELSRFGSDLVDYHLMKKVRLESASQLPSGSNSVDQTLFIQSGDDNGRVSINPQQAFGGVSRRVYEFRVGCYKVCEKWLKDRKGRVLSAKDVEHYRGILGAVAETIRIMDEIDRCIDAHGGWPGAFVTEKETTA